MTAPFRARPWLWAACLVLAAPLAQAATSFNGLYIFGDSLSDAGNAALAVGTDPAQVISSNAYVPARPYGSGTLSNGDVWATTFAQALGLSAAPSLAGGTNFAFGGARTSGGAAPSLAVQAGGLLSATGNLLPPDALYVVAGGGNNGRDALVAIAGGADANTTIATTAATYAADVGGIVDSLQAAGARHIVVWNAPNLGLTPAARLAGPAAQAGASFLTAQMNAKLEEELAGEQGVYTFDLYGLVTAVVQATQTSPDTSPFKNVTDACGNLAAGCDPATALFWDGIHPTTLGHQVIAGGMLATVAAIPEPSTYALMLGGLAAVGMLARRRGARAVPQLGA